MYVTPQLLEKSQCLSKYEILFLSLENLQCNTRGKKSHSAKADYKACSTRRRKKAPQDNRGDGDPLHLRMSEGFAEGESELS